MVERGRIRVVLMSTADVEDARGVVQAVVDDLNSGVAGDRLQLWRWDIDERPGVRLRGPEGSVETVATLVDDADLVLAAASHLGFPGNEPKHELARAWSSWQDDGRPEVLVYCRADRLDTRDEQPLHIDLGLPDVPMYSYRSVRELREYLRSVLIRLVVSRGTRRTETNGSSDDALGQDDSSDRVEWITDAAAVEDLLDRKPLVNALGRRMERLRQDEPGMSFLIHIDGPWGSGKSTLLGFLRAELGEDWLVVPFDAWRQQRVGPPWWAMLASLRHAISDHRDGRWGRLRLRAGEAWQRAPRLYVVLIVLLTAALCALVLLVPGVKLGGAETVARSLTVLVAGAAAAAGAAAGVGRFLLWESSLGARVFAHSHRDPMESLADHFAWLIGKAGRPVVFFVDDLDRCAHEYVVELLDSVQTLIRDAPARNHAMPSADCAAYMVVAADGRWIRTSYERAHESSGAGLGELGRPIGYLFLDKIFQLTVEVPSMSRYRQDAYLGLLLGSDVPRVDAGEQSAAASEQATVVRRVAASTNEAEALAVYQSASPDVRAAVAGDVVKKLAEERVERATDHALRKFAPLLEPNPRAMKRFVNAYGMTRALQVLADSVVPRDPLALWTILRVRWPALIDYVRGHPEVVDALAGATRAPEGVPEDLAPLFGAAPLARVVQFEHGGPLTAAQIRACCGMSDIPAATVRDPAPEPNRD